jgi:hypothetical protein
MTKHTAEALSNEELLQIMRRLLNTCNDLDFLVQLDQGDLERLLVAVRERVEGSGQFGQDHPRRGTIM